MGVVTSLFCGLNVTFRISPLFPIHIFILVNVFQSNVRTIQIDRAECRQDLHFPFVIEFDTVKGVVAIEARYSLAYLS